MSNTPQWRVALQAVARRRTRVLPQMAGLHLGPARCAPSLSCDRYGVLLPTYQVRDFARHGAVRRPCCRPPFESVHSSSKLTMRTRRHQGFRDECPRHGGSRGGATVPRPTRGRGPVGDLCPPRVYCSGRAGSSRLRSGVAAAQEFLEMRATGRSFSGYLSQSAGLSGPE